jgi:hypothetical protein
MDKNIDLEPIATALFALLNQLETASPGLAERHGWARIEDVSAFTTALMRAGQAEKPEGLL